MPGDVEDADHRQQAGGGHLGHPVVHRGRDQVGPDQPVGAGATDEEADRQQPEVAVAHAHRQAAERGAHRIAQRRRRLVSLGGAVGAQADVGRAVAHQEDRPAVPRSAQRPPRPERRARQPTLTASQASAGRKISCPVAPAAVSAPRTRPRRCTNQRLATVAASTLAIEPGADADHDAPQQVELPGLVHEDRSAPTPPKPSAALRPRRGALQSAPSARRRTGANRPNSTRLIETAIEMVARDQPNSCCEGHDQRRRRRPEAGRGQQRDPRDHGHDPGVVDPSHQNSKRQARGAYSAAAGSRPGRSPAERRRPNPIASSQAPAAARSSWARTWSARRAGSGGCSAGSLETPRGRSRAR